VDLVVVEERGAYDPNGPILLCGVAVRAEEGHASLRLIALLRNHDVAASGKFESLCVALSASDMEVHRRQLGIQIGRALCPVCASAKKRSEKFFFFVQCLLLGSGERALNCRDWKTPSLQDSSDAIVEWTSYLLL
jgi:hypothetical protein